MKSSIFNMKKVVILFTIFLISCGSEEGTYDLHHPAEEVNGVSLVDCLVSKGWENIPTIELRGDRVHLIFDEPFDVERYDVLQEECLQELHDVASQSEEEGTEAVEEIVVLETQKKEENSGISEEDFDEYIAGLEDYGAGGSFVPIPLKLDDFKPLTESGNCLSDDVTVIEPREYIYLLIEAYWSTREDMTYGYVSENGNVTRNGPFATWSYEKLVAINSQYILEEFDEFFIEGGERLPEEGYTIYWNDYETLLKSLCSIKKDNRGYLEMIMSTQELISWGQLKYSWHLSNWERFDYITTGRNIIKPVTPHPGLEVYTKYIATSGVIITAVDDVPDEAVLQAYDSITRMLSKRPDFHQILYDGYARMMLFWGDGFNHGLPEWEGEEIQGGFAGGFTGGSTANAAWQCYPGNIDRGGDPVIHELVHQINHQVFEAINEVYFYERIFNYAMDAIEKGTYATNYEQQLEEGVVQDSAQFIGEYWATTNEGMAMNKAGFKNSHDKIDWVKENDPNMFALAERYFPTEPWDYCSDVEY